MMLKFVAVLALLSCSGNCQTEVLTASDQPTNATIERECPTSQPRTAEFSNHPCAEIQRSTPNISLSGYYWIQGSDGAAVNVYCKMNSRGCCGFMGNWMRVAYLDMKNSSHSCPSGFQLYDSNGPRRCGLHIARSVSYAQSYRPNPYSSRTAYRVAYKEVYDAPGCSQLTYTTHRIPYQWVCGKITAYQKGTTDAFYNHYSQNSSIYSAYVDGVSITHGSSKQHIWTFAAAGDELRADQWRCPCSKCNQNFTGRVPSYVGNDYFCDSGTLLFANPEQTYTADPLWDGSGCAPASACCNFNSPPWFCKKLLQPSADDIELRVCRDESGNDEDIQISSIELYVR